MADNPPRLLQGYGAAPPRPQWTAPNGEPARLAVQLSSTMRKTVRLPFEWNKQSEWLLSRDCGATPYDRMRRMNMESLYEYGSRVGFGDCIGCSPNERCLARSLRLLEP